MVLCQWSPTAKLQSPCPPITEHREPSWPSVFRAELTCGLGHARDLVGQPHARQAEERGQETEDLCKREGPGGAQGQGQSRGQPFQRTGSSLCLFPVLPVAAREPGDSSDLAACPHAGTGVMPGPRSGLQTGSQPGLWAPPLTSSPDSYVPPIRFMFTAQLQATSLYPGLIRQKKEEQYILFGVLNI